MYSITAYYRPNTSVHFWPYSAYNNQDQVTDFWINQRSIGNVQDIKFVRQDDNFGFFVVKWGTSDDYFTFTNEMQAAFPNYEAERIAYHENTNSLFQLNLYQDDLVLIEEGTPRKLIINPVLADGAVTGTVSLI